jgi:6-phosphogluconolactonase (cycloisomerase 2 family)
MLSTIRATRRFTIFAIMSVLAACGGGGGSPPPPPPPPVTTYTVTATVTGLAGSGLTLLDNGGDSKAVSANGSVTFATALANAAAYAVTVGTRPTTPSQTCTVTNGSGTIAGANIVNVAVACVTQAFTVGGTVSGLAGSGLQLQNNAGDTLNVSQNGSFTFATAILSGANYAVSVSANPANPIQQCVVTNGSGAVGNANVTNAAIVCTTQTPRTALSLNYYSGSATGYFVDAPSGQLRFNALLKLGTSPITFVGDKAGKFLFFLNQGTAQSPADVPPVPQTPSSISVFALDPVTGNPREVNGSPFPTSSGQAAATGLAILPGDAFIYVTNNSLNNIEAFSINSTGALSTVPGSPFSTGSSPNPVTFDGAGHFAYVSHNNASPSVFVYTVNSATGALTELPANRLASGQATSAVSLTADGKFAHILNASYSVSAYSVNSATGVLADVPNSPFLVPSGTGLGSNSLLSLFYHPNGKVLYVKNDGGTGTGWLSAFSMDSNTGALGLLAGSPYTLGTSATGLVGFDPAARFLYVANQGSCTVLAGCTPTSSSIGSISAFRLDTAGALTSITGLSSVTPPPYQVSVDPSGEFLYQSTVDSDQVSTYSINQTSGALTKLQRGSPSRAGGEPVYIAAFTSPTNSAPISFRPKFAYVPNVTDNNISMFASDPQTGKLSVIAPPIPVGNLAPQTVAVSARGDLAFIPTAGPSPTTSSGLIDAYSIDPTTGALSGIGTPLSTGKGPSSVATDRTGRYFYIANAYDGTISNFTVDVMTGVMSVNGSPTPVGFSNPIGVVVDPTGRNLYALGVSNVEVFEINAATGSLTPSQVGYPLFGPAVVTLPATGATQIAIDPFGNFAYIPILGAKMIAVYQIDPYSGALFDSLPQQIVTGRSNTTITIDPTGRFAYTADSTDNTITAYSIDPATGALTVIGSPIPVSANAFSITADYSGKFVYVVLANNSVVSYAIGSTGALTPVAGGVAVTGNGPGPISAVGGIQ